MTGDFLYYFDTISSISLWSVKYPESWGSPNKRYHSASAGFEYLDGFHCETSNALYSSSSCMELKHWVCIEKVSNKFLRPPRSQAHWTTYTFDISITNFPKSQNPNIPRSKFAFHISCFNSFSRISVSCAKLYHCSSSILEIEINEILFIYFIETLLLASWFHCLPKYVVNILMP